MIIILILGVALWIVPHVLKRVAPARREALGDRGKGVIAALIGLSILLMIVGYRWAAFIPVYTPPAWGVHLNNLLVLIGFYLFAVSGAKSRLHRFMRHPQLTGFSLWAAAHLLVNGHLAAVILFGGLLLWALSEMVLINRAEPTWLPPEAGPLRKEITTVLAALVLYGVVGWIHGLIGPWPFG